MRFDPSIVTVKQSSIVSQIVSSPVVLSSYFCLISSRSRLYGAGNCWLRCRNRARVGLSVGISVTVGVPSNKVRVVVALTKNVVKMLSLAYH